MSNDLFIENVRQIAKLMSQKKEHLQLQAILYVNHYLLKMYVEIVWESKS